jgi:hypothetical protein
VVIIVTVVTVVTVVIVVAAVIAVTVVTMGTVVTVDTVVNVVTVVTVGRPSPDRCTGPVSVRIHCIISLALISRNPIGLSHSCYITTVDLLCLRPYLHKK